MGDPNIERGSIMPEKSVIVWDLETVPDLAAAARMLDLGNVPEADVRQALGAGGSQSTR